MFTPGDSTWTDYLGPQPYVDYTIESGSPPVIEEQMRYLAGFGVHAQQTVTWGTGSQPVIGEPMFLHGDLTRSTMMTTDTSATVLSRVACTTFGDPVTPVGQGGWRVRRSRVMGRRPPRPVGDHAVDSARTRIPAISSRTAWAAVR
ncbi:MAG: hypothetical protein AB1601_06050 [Planctomycetota bacterium]